MCDCKVCSSLLPQIKIVKGRVAVFLTDGTNEEIFIKNDDGLSNSSTWLKNFVGKKIRIIIEEVKD